MRTTILLTALLAATPAIADEEVTHPFVSSISRAAIRRLVIDIPAGEISIRNGAADRIRLSGESRREYDGYRERDKQQKIVDDISAEIYVNGDEAVLRQRFGPNARSWSAQSWHSGIRATVEVPRDLDVEIETHYGELTLEGEFGNVNADLRAGEIHLRIPRASVHELSASVRIGEVHADLGDSSEVREGIFPSSVHFFNAGGRSRINVHTTVGELHITLTR